MTTTGSSPLESTARICWSFMSSIRNSEWWRPRALVFVLLAACAAGGAQNAVVTVSSPYSRVIGGAQAQLTAAITDIVGTPIDASGLVWSVSDATIASVSGQGLLTGIAPGD